MSYNGEKDLLSEKRLNSLNRDMFKPFSLKTLSALIKEIHAFLLN